MKIGARKLLFATLTAIFLASCGQKAEHDRHERLNKTDDIEDNRALPQPDSIPDTKIPVTLKLEDGFTNLGSNLQGDPLDSITFNVDVEKLSFSYLPSLGMSLELTKELFRQLDPCTHNESLKNIHKEDPSDAFEYYEILEKNHNFTEENTSRLFRGILSEAQRRNLKMESQPEGTIEGIIIEPEIPEELMDDFLRYLDEPDSSEAPINPEEFIEKLYKYLDEQGSKPPAKNVSNPVQDTVPPVFILDS